MVQSTPVVSANHNNHAPSCPPVHEDEPRPSSETSSLNSDLTASSPASPSGGEGGEGEGEREKETVVKNGPVTLVSRKLWQREDVGGREGGEEKERGSEAGETGDQEREGETGDQEMEESCDSEAVVEQGSAALETQSVEEAKEKVSMEAFL